MSRNIERINQLSGEMLEISLETEISSQKLTELAENLKVMVEQFDSNL